MNIFWESEPLLENKYLVDGVPAIHEWNEMKFEFICVGFWILKWVNDIPCIGEQQMDGAVSNSATFVLIK